METCRTYARKYSNQTAEISKCIYRTTLNTYLRNYQTTQLTTYILDHQGTKYVTTT